MNAKFDGLEPRRCEDITGIDAPEKFRNFWETGPWGRWILSQEQLLISLRNHNNNESSGVSFLRPFFFFLGHFTGQDLLPRG